MKFSLFLACLLLLSCSDNKGFNYPTHNRDTLNRDTTNYAITDTTGKAPPKNIEAPEGIYQVVLPCPDCKGIEHTVSFNPDLTYHIEELKLGRQSETQKTEGNWKPGDGKIWLYKDSSVKARYVWQGGTLLYLEPSGNAIPMQKLTAVTDNVVWRNKGKEGFEFFGTGNEPFWSIEINEQKSISFQQADWHTALKFTASKPYATPDSIVYSARNDSIALRITIYNTFCTDGMSENIYNNKVKVYYNNQVYNGCGVLYRKFR